MAVRVRAASRPGNQQLEKLHAALKVCGSENGDPLAVSRDQFVAIAAHELPNEFGGEKGRKVNAALCRKLTFVYLWRNCQQKGIQICIFIKILIPWYI